MTIFSIVKKIIVVIFLVEMAIMVFFSRINLRLDPYSEALLDAILLSLLSAPFIYFWVVNPFIHDLKGAVDKIKHLAWHDPITGLPNIRYLESHLNEVIEKAKNDNLKFAFVHFEIDGLAEIKDDINHEVADLALKEIGEKFQNEAGNQEFISHHGGNSFSMIIPGIEEVSEVEHRVNQFKNNCLDNLNLGGMKVDVGISFGIALFPDHGDSYRKLRTQAEVEVLK